MPSQQSIDILLKAMKIWQVAYENPTENQYRDTISLIALAIKKEPEPFPVAYSLLTQIHFDVENYDDAWETAEITLSLDPYDYKAQLIRVYIAFAYTWDAIEVAESHGGLLGGIGKLIQARGGYQAGEEFGSGVAHRKNAKNLKQVANSEFSQLISLYQHMSKNGSTASDFIDFSQKLITLADGIYSNPKILENNINIYALVANSPINKLDFETDEEKEQIEMIQLIAEGRTS